MSLRSTIDFEKQKNTPTNNNNLMFVGVFF